MYEWNYSANFAVKYKYLFGRSLKFFLWTFASLQLNLKQDTGEDKLNIENKTGGPILKQGLV